MTIIPVDKEKHINKGWIPFKDLSFAKKTTILPVTCSELPKLSMAVPIVLIKIDEDYHFAAILGLENEKNLYVNKDGKWVSGYVPKVLQAHPFSIAINKSNKAILCVNDEYTVKSSDNNAEPFFTDNGDISEKLKRVLGFLEQREIDRQKTKKMCNLLDVFGIIEPAKVTIRVDRGDIDLKGYYQINEMALQKLEDEKFLELRASSALPFCYFHLLSLYNWRTLADLDRGRSLSDQKMRELGNQIFDLSPDQTLNFENLK